jgi:hypothetical protein
MHRVALAALALTLAGCVSPPPSDTAARPPRAQNVALSVIGTPFLIAAKVPVCVAAATIAAPLAALSQLAGDYRYPGDGYQRIRLNDELADPTC